MWPIPRCLWTHSRAIRKIFWGPKSSQSRAKSTYLAAKQPGKLQRKTGFNHCTCTRFSGCKLKARTVSRQTNWNLPRAFPVSAISTTKSFWVATSPKCSASMSPRSGSSSCRAGQRQWSRSSGSPKRNFRKVRTPKTWNSGLSSIVRMKPRSAFRSLKQSTDSQRKSLRRQWSVKT